MIVSKITTTTPSTRCKLVFLSDNTDRHIQDLFPSMRTCIIVLIIRVSHWIGNFCQRQWANSHQSSHAQASPTWKCRKNLTTILSLLSTRKSCSTWTALSALIARDKCWQDHWQQGDKYSQEPTLAVTSFPDDQHSSATLTHPLWSSRIAQQSIRCPLNLCQDGHLCVSQSFGVCMTEIGNSDWLNLKSRLGKGQNIISLWGRESVSLPPTYYLFLLLFHCRFSLRERWHVLSVLVMSSQEDEMTSVCLLGDGEINLGWWARHTHSMCNGSRRTSDWPPSHPSRRSPERTSEPLDFCKSVYASSFHRSDQVTHTSQQTSKSDLRKDRDRVPAPTDGDPNCWRTLSWRRQSRCTFGRRYVSYLSDVRALWKDLNDLVSRVHPLCSILFALIVFWTSDTGSCLSSDVDGPTHALVGYLPWILHGRPDKKKSSQSCLTSLQPCQHQMLSHVWLERLVFLIGWDSGHKSLSPLFPAFLSSLFFLSPFCVAYFSIYVEIHIHRDVLLGRLSSFTALFCLNEDFHVWLYLSV